MTKRRITIQLLRQVPLLKYLRSEELEELSWFTSLREWGRKSVIFAEEDLKDSIYFVLSGLVKTYNAKASGFEENVAFMKSGDLLPQEGLLTAGIYTVSAAAISQTELMVISYKPFQHFLAINPDAAAAVIRAMDDMLSTLHSKLREQTLQGAQNPVQLFLLKLAEHYDCSERGSLRIGMPMSHEDFAQTTGTSRDRVDSLLHRLHEEGIMDMKRSGFVIHDVEALRRWRG